MDKLIEFRTRSTFNNVGHDGVTNKMYIFNAPRHLVGDVTWIGEFLSGIYYAACDRDSEFFKQNVETNKKLDACVVVTINEHDVKQWAREKFPHKYEVIIADVSLLEWARTRTIDFFNSKCSFIVVKGN